MIVVYYAFRKRCVAELRLSYLPVFFNMSFQVSLWYATDYGF